MRKMFESFIADRQLRIVTTLILCFSAIILMLPFCFTQISAIVDFTETGQIGDTIGGITAPFFAICSIYVTFLAFWIQYKFNSAQKTDLDKERFEHNFFSYLDVLMRQEQSCTLDNVGFGKQVFHYMFYEYKAIYNIVHKGDYLKAVTNSEERKKEERNLSFSIFINGVSEDSTYRLNKEVADICKPQVLLLNKELLQIQKEIMTGKRVEYPKYLRDYEGQRIKLFDGHRLRLISYFRMSCMVLQYINTTDENKRKFYINVCLSHFSEHQLGLLMLMINQDEFESKIFIDNRVKEFFNSQLFIDSYLPAKTMRYNDEDFIV